MAIRKSTIQQQVWESVQQVIAPGDRPIGMVPVVTGWNPFVVWELGGIIGQLIVDYYFLTFTEQGVILHRTSRMTNRPKEVVAVYPRNEFFASGFRKGFLWSKFYYQTAQDPKRRRMNVHRMWKPELSAIMATLGVAEGAAAPAAPQQPAVGYQPQGQIPQQGMAPQYPAQQQPPVQPGYPQQPGAAPQYPGAPQQPPQAPQGYPGQVPPQGYPQQGAPQQPPQGGYYPQ